MKYKTSRKSRADSIFQNICTALIAIATASFVFIGIVKLMNFNKKPYLLVSSEVLEDDGKFDLSTEYSFVKEAYNPNGEKMTFGQLKKLAEKENPSYNMDWCDKKNESQW
jgi:hypothetical protein